MDVTHALMQRPTRWKEPFDAEMDAALVQQIMAVRPFSMMDPSRFSKSVPLTGIIQNDCRLLQLDDGDIIVREGDYGNSAFLIISGEARVCLKSLPTDLLGRVQSKRKSLFSTVAQLWKNDQHPEVRRYTQSKEHQLGHRDDRQGTRVFLTDIPRILGPEDTESMYAGEIFGEASALARTPRSATVIAGGPTKLLEIRWQGLRDLMKGDAAFQKHVEKCYRDNSLKAHLREVSLFSRLEPEQIESIAAETHFETYGKFQWNIDYRSTQTKDISERILDEPAIVNQGEYVNSLFLIRNGFVRICRNHGEGIQTVAYMGKGGIFGLREIAHNWTTGQQRPWALSLRAVGYVDVLRIPVAAIEQHALSWLDAKDIPAPFVDSDEPKNKQKTERRRTGRKPEMDRGLLEFLVEQRFTNGAKAMMIDLNRCTRCDDCVRACASTHNNNPRFVRQGQIHDNWMITNACMHCIDPVCMIGCPTGAIARDAASGNVTINDATCIGCATCANSCPYENIRMVEINDPAGKRIVDVETREPIRKATKCDFCQDQLGGPACQRACPHDALIRIDLTDPTEVTEWTK